MIHNPTLRLFLYKPDPSKKWMQFTYLIRKTTQSGEKSCYPLGSRGQFLSSNPRNPWLERRDSRTKPVKRAGEVLGDRRGIASFDLMTFQHVHDLAVSKDPD